MLFYLLFMTSCQRVFFSVLGFLCLSTAIVGATPIGYHPDPAGSAWDRNDPGTAWASWDSFPSASFTGDTPEASFGIISPELDQSSPVVPPGGVFGSGDRIYTHFSDTFWSLTGSTSFIIQGAILQIKEHQGSVLSSLLNPTLNGLAFDVLSSSSFTEGANTQTLYTFVWNAGLIGQSITSFSFDFGIDITASPASLDGMQIDLGPVAAVPEPATALMGSFGLVVLGLARHQAKRCGRLLPS